MTFKKKKKKKKSKITSAHREQQTQLGPDLKICWFAVT